VSKPAYPGQNPSRAVAQRERDAALNRVSRVRRVTIFGAGALTAALAAVVSAAAGRTLGAKVPLTTHPVVAKRTRGSTALPKMPPLASPRALGLRAPSSSPQAAPQTQTQAQAPAPQTQTQTQPAAPVPQPAVPVAPQPPPVSGGS
jgi:hypothetical protein